jgi:hypothetical protein
MKLGIDQMCKLCQDTYHFLSNANGAWPKFLGTQSWPRFKEDFKLLVQILLVHGCQLPTNTIT